MAQRQFRVQFSNGVLRALGGVDAVDELYHQYRTKQGRKPRGKWRCTVATTRGNLDIVFCSDVRGTRISLPTEALSSSRPRGS